MKKINKISRLDALQYEVHSHCIASWVSNNFIQELFSRYFAWKVARKYKRYSTSVDFRNKISN